MHPLDWTVMAAYAVLVVWIGWRTGRGHQTTEDLFLGGRRVPAWAAFCSMVATELSAATFVGVPQVAYGGDWWYLQYAVGSLLARIVLATWFLSLYHRMKLVTVYGLLDQRFGRKSELCSAWFFLVGRLFASGARLYMAGLAFATVLEASFGPQVSLEWAIVIGGLIAGVYTLLGGIRAVIWTDTLQGAVFMVSAITAVCVIAFRIEGGLETVWSSAAAVDRLDVINLPAFLATGTSASDAWTYLAETWNNFRTNYLASDTSLGVAIIGGFFLTMATHGTDQDMVQRLLTTRDGKRGGAALIASGLANFPVVFVFLGVGTCLWAFYQSDAAVFDGSYDIARVDRIFPVFVLREVPLGLRGLIFAGLFAAAMSSMDSALNSLATTWVVNIRRGQTDPAKRLRTTRVSTVIFGTLLIASAVLLWHYKQAVEEKSGVHLDLIPLALSSMTIVYGGLLGAFLVALIAPHRGTDRSVMFGMIAGGVTGLLLFLHPLVTEETVIVWPWWIVISSIISFTIGSWPKARKP